MIKAILIFLLLGSSAMALSKKHRIQLIKDYAKQRKFSDSFIAGLLGNVERESGFNPFAFRANDAGAGKHSYGLFQWNRRRKDGIFNLLELRGFKNPEKIFLDKGSSLSEKDKKLFIKTQLDYALDLDKETHGGKSWDNSKRLQKLFKSKDLEKIKDAFARFEGFQGYNKPEHSSYKKHHRLIDKHYGSIVSPQSTITEQIDIEEKFKIPKDRSKIIPWMKKYGWKGSDLGRIVNGKWKGYHPGDVIKSKVESKGPRFDKKDFEEFKKQEAVEKQPDPKYDPRFAPDPELEMSDKEWETYGVIEDEKDYERSPEEKAPKYPGMGEWEGKVSPGAEHRGGMGGFRAKGDPTRERIEEQIGLMEQNPAGGEMFAEASEEEFGDVEASEQLVADVEVDPAAGKRVRTVDLPQDISSETEEYVEEKDKLDKISNSNIKLMETITQVKEKFEEVMPEYASLFNL